MSCYGWEAGELKVPSAEWVKLKAAVREAHNRIQDQRYERACAVHTQLLAQGKAKRRFDYQAAFDTAWESHAPRAAGRAWWVTPPRDEVYDDPDAHHAIFGALFPQARASRTARPVLPKKKDFPHATNKQRDFRVGEASIRFSDDARRTVRYASGDNNHAVERAHAQRLVQAFFAALQRVVWTRGTGGSLAGNNEYNRESRDSGAGSNYTTATYGPLGGRPVGKREAQLAIGDQRILHRTIRPRAGARG